MSTESVAQQVQDAWLKSPNPYDSMPEEEVRAAAEEVFDERPLEHHNYAGGYFEVSPTNGIRYFKGDDEPTWICSELRIEGDTRDPNSQSWGRWLSWRDQDRKHHTWAMPRAALIGDVSESLRTLASGGLTIAAQPKSQRLLLAYLNTAESKMKIRCVSRLGWFNSAYVTPTETIGDTDSEKVVFQSEGSAQPERSASGTVKEWRDHVAALAGDNSRLVFAISTAFAGPLLDIIGEDSGGFHLYGHSSTGKTTALLGCASVYGKPSDYMRSWRATDNGLEGQAAIHNDGVLVLDELSQCAPDAAARAAYMLGNGQAKGRMARNGEARSVASWRLLFLSSGEVTLSSLLATIGHKMNAGQEVRLVDIPADAGHDLGLFEELHGATSAALFAERFKESASRYHGAVGREWLRYLVSNRGSIAMLLRDGIRQLLEEAVPVGASGQVSRVARRVAIVAVAGELASHYGLTGWPEGEAIRAVKACFGAWSEGYGSGDREDAAVVDKVSLFIERNGASRFQSMEAENPLVVNRAGFWRETDGKREYLILPRVFKDEVVAGHSLKQASKALRDACMLRPGENNRSQRNEYLPGIGRTRVYVITAQNSSETEEAA